MWTGASKARRVTTVWLLGCIMLAMALVPGSASAATQCAGGWCVAPAKDFPNVTGPYGLVWGPNAQEPIYDYVGGQWTHLPGHVLAPGTPVYVAPFTSGWRWVYTEHLSWCIIDANNLWLRWQS